MNRPQKTRGNPAGKTKAVKKLDSGTRPEPKKLNGNHLEIPRRRKGDSEPANPKPSAPYPEKGKPVWFVIVLLTLWLQFSVSAAQPSILGDGNSSVSIDSGSPSGVNNWFVDGQNQLNREWFWYRIGNSGTASSIDTISTPTLFQPTAGALSAIYQNTQFSLQVVYSLVGGAAGSGTADLAEQIKIQNLGSAPLAFNFFQYSDFSLGGVENQSVDIGQNSQGKFNEAEVTSGTASVMEDVDTAVSPGANRAEAALADSTLNHLQNTGGYDLDDNLDAGPGDATWALEWNNNIPSGGTLTISEDLNVTGISPVPEPPVWSMLSLGLIALGSVKSYFRR